MGKNFWVNEKDFRTVVVCDKCLELNRKINLRSKEHWVNLGNYYKLREKAKKEHAYPIYRIQCLKGHEIEIDFKRTAFFREGLEPKELQ